MRKFVLLVVLGLGAIVSQAQTQSTKIGYADVDYIFEKMPESKQVESELKTVQTQLKNQIDAKYAEFQKKYQEYTQNQQTMLEAVRLNTERELQQLQQNIEKLQQDAQTTIQGKQIALMKPVYDKVGKAIEDVAKENGYTFILSGQVGGIDVVLYADESANVSDVVLKKMGVNPTATAAPAPTKPATTKP